MSARLSFLLPRHFIAARIGASRKVAIALAVGPRREQIVGSHAGDIVEEPRLPDARLTDDDHGASSARGEPLEEILSLHELRTPSDERP